MSSFEFSEEEFIRSKVIVASGVFGRLPDELKIRAWAMRGREDPGDWETVRRAVLAGEGSNARLFREILGSVGDTAFSDGDELFTFYQHAWREAIGLGSFLRFAHLAQAFPCVEYQTGYDCRDAKRHRELNGRLLGWDDVHLFTHWPPSCFGCDCDTIPRTRAQVGQRKIVNLPEASWFWRPDRYMQPFALSKVDEAIRDWVTGNLHRFAYRLADGNCMPIGN